MYTSNQDDHNDLFQEMILQLWKAFPSFRNEAKITTFMYRIALNTAISGIRKKKIKTTELESISFQIKETIEENFSDELKLLHASIEQLSDVEKSIVLLFLEDKPYDEIAEITGISANYVAVKMNRIKEKLRKLLNVK
ncbi:MAG: RNA polymerase sigma factor [Saprospirales bacterium]|nr:RNA polymerase sigma factor [Saprospirales bacterium]MBK8350367.1 RNA polymerase sigma factor [Saprospirales bacterium]